MTRNHYILGVIILAIIVGAYFYGSDRALAPTGDESNELDSFLLDAGPDTVNGVDLIDSEGNTTSIDAELIPATRDGDETASKNIPVPDLSRRINFSTASDSTKANIEKLSAELKTDSLNMSKWFGLAQFRKSIEDYEGAILIWEYTAKLVPVDPVSLLNVGNVRHFYLKQYPESENAFRRVIANTAPNPVSEAYLGLHELYRYSYKEKAALADDVLIEGLVLEPENLYLMVTLAAYYRDEGEKTNARTYYEKALTIAKRDGDTKLQASLEKDLSTL
ncbi:MAG: hypothetical protein COV10_04885 [Candidatus Vogelbacteria bacterium CG10_big_fil_rev_8_21_14_0_10_51_16]|uniref:Uncharacterized protein n=1 Tax=Candidatus Vogelbacteria bacterium CG10_big_fil_rev_8_21_14_0_10_51_16 TaxID=1975045 RepID=A0A2H0RF65_9BACT|nr:MAG: hypothetical protein COV10_04885 [Candidatus Vogelbacteria bacterium CG10_big_fil_rev_8_21_14_0_10_51_16]